MKVLEVYEGNKRELVSDGVNVFNKMDEFFRKKPSEYRKLYDRNLTGLKLYRVDEFYDQDSSRGEYDTGNNIILFKDYFAVPHELVHMATTDREDEKFAFVNGFMNMEIALIEGMTELEASKIMGNDKPIAYYFEHFCALMISNIDGIEKAFFTADGEGFIKLFPDKKDIYSLMYSLSYYSHGGSIIQTKEDISYVTRAIQDTINSLIDIELSYERDIDKLKIYKEKFMDMISDKDVALYLKEVYPDYRNYAYHEVKKRIKTRKGIFRK